MRPKDARQPVPAVGTLPPNANTRYTESQRKKTSKK